MSGEGATRVLVITTMYPPHHLGGYELSCADVVERWRRRGHDVSVLTTKMRLPDVADPASERGGGERAPVWRDLSFYWDDHEVTAPPVWRRALAERANQQAVNAALDRCRPDIISVWHMGAINLALLTSVRMRSIPMVFNLLDPWLVYERELDAWTRVWRGRPHLGRAVAWATGVHTAVPDVGDAMHCFCSEFVLRSCATDPVWPFHRTEITPLGVDRVDFPPISPTAASRRARRPFEWRLLYVGRVERRKGMATMIRALALLPPDATITFIGRGDTQHLRELEALATDLDVRSRVSFEAVPRAELARCYAEADAFVFPSEWDEPFGLVPLEAMACATPVIATRTGGSAEFLQDGDNCLAFPPGDPEALAAAVTCLAGDPDLRARLVSSGLDTAERLTADRLTAQLELIHLAEIDRARSSAPARP